MMPPGDINGRNALKFDGVANRMTTATFAQASPYTLGVVLQNDSGANSTAQVVISDITNQRSIQKGASNFWLMFMGNTLSTAIAPDTSGHYLIVVCKNTPNAVIGVDGTETTGNAGNGSWAGGVNIGANNAASFWNGMIAEIVVYSNEVTPTDRTALGSYFTNKWFTAPPSIATPGPLVSPTAVHQAANW